MFAISAGKTFAPAGEFAPKTADRSAVELLDRFCVVDRWSADLDNAVLNLGETASRFHGLDSGTMRFGLLEFVRCYNARAAYEIIKLFEQAAASGRPFHYSAELKSATPEKRLVHCFGDFQDDSASSGGRLGGIFLLARQEFRREG